MKTFNFSVWALTMLLMFMIGKSYSQQTYNPEALVPLDPAFKTGVLGNGIKYILRGDLPEKKAYFNAFFNIGSIQEEPNEYGVAHLLEHLCFNGKKNYLDYFYAKGMDMGEYINAGTGMERTSYTIFKVPLQNERLLDSTLLFLRALSFTLNLQPEVLEKERKIVLEEWRLGYDASARMNAKTESLALKGSKFSRPYIIGDTAVINHCTVNDVKNFFNKWYRPDHLTVIVIGGFDVAKMETKVKQIFSQVPKAEGKSPRIAYTIPDNKEPIINIVSDSEASTGEIEIHYKHNSPAAYNQQQLRTDYIDKMIDRMFTNRLDKITDSSNPPFAKASAACNINYYRSPAYDEYLFDITTNKDIKTALESILTENERIIKYGFTKPEFQNAKNVFLKNYGPTQKEFKFPYNEYYVQCYYYILKGKTWPSFNYSRNFVNKILPAITLEEVNERFKAYTSKIQPVISIACPQKDLATTPNVDEVKNIMVSIPLQKIEPYINTITPTVLFDKKVKSGVVTKQTANSELGTTEWRLSNGMRIIIKPTEFKPDDIQFKGFRNRDTLLRLKDGYSTTLMYAGRSLKKMGVDAFSANELGQLLSGKHLSVEPALSAYGPGISGNASTKDFESALQLSNLYYSNQRWSENVLTKELQYYKTYNVEKSSLAAFDDTIQKYWTVSMKDRGIHNLSEVSLEKLKTINKYVFNNPAEFTFIFSGSLKPEKVKPLIEKYLGSIIADNDSTNKKNIFDSIKNKKPLVKEKTWYETGRKSCEFTHPMKTPSASVYVFCQGKMKDNQTNALYGSMALDLMVIQCANTIRGKYGASYRVGLFDRMMSNDSWQGHVYFQTNPKIAGEMKNIAMDEMKKFMEGDINEEEFNICKNKLIKKRSEELKSNQWWVNNALPDYYLSKKSIVPTYLEEVKNLTLEGLKSFTRSIYEQGNIIDVVMKSE